MPPPGKQRLQADAAGTALPFRGPGFQKAPNAGGAVAALVFGILGVATFVYGIIFAILALVFGYRARAAIQSSGGRLGGAGLATAGRVLGWVWFGVVGTVVVLTALLYAAIGSGDNQPETLSAGTAMVFPGQARLQGFWIYSNQTVSFGCLSDVAVNCSIIAVDEAREPHWLGEPPMGEDVGTRAEGQLRLTPGDYALLIRCEGPEPCPVEYQIRRDAA